jgi:hypothetical protein
VSAQTGRESQTYRDYYRERGTTFSQSVTSDPRGSPYPVGPYPNDLMRSGTPPGSTANMSRETRLEQVARIRSEQDARDKRVKEWREPPLKFNIAPPQMPKPNAME